MEVAIATRTPVDPKRLARLAREPARVFGFSEVRTYRWPVVMVKLGDVAWFGPGHGPWLMRGDGCPILLRAIERMGTTRANEAHRRTFERQLVTEGQPLSLPDPVLITLGDKHITAVHDLGGGCLIPAVPVAYAARRWPGGEWQRLAYPVVRYHYEGEPVALIAAIVPDG